MVVAKSIAPSFFSANDVSSLDPTPAPVSLQVAVVHVAPSPANSCTESLYAPAIDGS